MTAEEIAAAIRTRLEALDAERSALEQALAALPAPTPAATEGDVNARGKRRAPELVSPAQNTRRRRRLRELTPQRLEAWAREQDGPVTIGAVAAAFGVPRGRARAAIDELDVLEPLGEGRARRGWRLRDAAATNGAGQADEAPA